MTLTSMATYCIIDQKLIPPERAIRKSNTCSKECNKALKAIRRALVDRRRCRHCNKPSTPEDRKAYKTWRRQNPEANAPKRGRPSKYECDTCDGTGLMEGWNRRDGHPCPKCHGKGFVPASKNPKQTAAQAMAAHP